MAKEKGLTGIHEVARGFVGRTPVPKLDTTKNGRSRIRFTIACGQNNESSGKFPTWRYCIAYGQVAEQLSNLKTGMLVKCIGWLSTEAMLDEYYRPITDDKGLPQRKEHLILHEAEIIEYDKKPELQRALIGN